MKKNFRIICFLLVLTFTLTLLVGCGKTLSATPDKTTLEVGEETGVSVECAGAGVDDFTLSTDSDCVEISGKTVKALSAGEAKITVRANVGGTDYVATFKLTVLAPTDPVIEPEPEPETTSATIYIAGDSTVKTYGDDQFIAGWGQYLSYYLDSENVTVVNMSEGGRSSRSFINEGRLFNIEGNTVGKTSIESLIDANTAEDNTNYLFIQFGHNDDNSNYMAAKSSYYSTVFDRMVPLGTPDTNGKYPVTAGEKVSTSALPTAYADYASATEQGTALTTIAKYGATYYSYDCGATYKWYLKQYIDFAREEGAIPVLITPVARVKLNSDGILQSGNGLHGENFAYVQAVRQLAQEENCLLIDLFDFSKNLIETATKDYANYLMALKPNAIVGEWPSDYDTSFGTTDGIEGTHYNKYGAFLLSAYVAETLLNYGQKGTTASEGEKILFTDGIKTEPSIYIAAPSALANKKGDLNALFKKMKTDGVNPVDTRPTVYIVGDSTLCDFSDSSADAKYYYPRVGYGVKIGDYLEGVNVVNYALSGRSSLSFLLEINYTMLCNKISEGDYLIIAFGHNDEKAEAARYTNPNGTVEEEGSFKYVLFNNYIKMAQDAGATPILCTPIVRRSTSDSYEGNNGHITVDANADGVLYKGGDYPKAIRELGEEKSVTVIDMTALTKAMYTAQTAAVTIDYHAQTTSNAASVDNTHLNVYGAAKMAYTFATELKQTQNGLAAFVLETMTEPNKATLLKVNPNYTEIDYNPNYTSSAIWTSIEEGWEGTVFGDVGGDSKISTTNFDLSSVAGVFTLKAGIAGNTGKIASSSDGIAMIFKQVNADDDFTLEAIVKILSIDNSNNQVSFGLMVRDDIYIDTFNAAIGSDYVAGGIMNMAKGIENVNTAFMRDNKAISAGTKGIDALPTTDSEYVISITKVGDTYTVNFDGTISTFTVDLSEIDENFNYIGFFVSRRCQIEVSSVVLTMK